jgi:3-oxoacyl-[acyl-carrier protein] reductase
MKVMISGASRGLGEALVRYFCQEHQVVSFARGELAFTHPNLKHYAGIDASNASDLDKIAEELPSVDGLINNVGVAYDGILATQGPESIRSMLDVNIFSALYLTKLYLRGRLPARCGGSVVSISSIISIRGFSGLATYSATKGALNSMTKALAREMGGKGFRFNAVLPGYFESEMSKGMGDSKKQQVVRRTPLGRLATTDDICPLVGFLLSDASRFITGQLISVDGGLTC